jgi:hypothetical protein
MHFHPYGYIPSLLNRGLHCPGVRSRTLPRAPAKTSHTRVISTSSVPAIKMGNDGGQRQAASPASYITHTAFLLYRIDKSQHFSSHFETN